VQAVRIVSVVGVVAALAAAFWWTAPRDVPAKPEAAAPQAKPDRPTVAFGILPVTEDHFVQAPCSRIAAGGLMSIPAFVSEIAERFPNYVAISMGDLTQSFGAMGRHAAAFHYTDVMPKTGVTYVAAGEGELGLGAGYVREVLTRTQGVTFVCANAADDNGLPLMRGWVLLKSGERGVLLVAVASATIEGELRRRGSDVRILSAADAVAKARADGLAQAALTGIEVEISALFVHGTLDEAAALVAGAPGFTFAAAAHGGAMPDAEPRMVGGVPVLYGGTDLRFGWRVRVPGDGTPPFPSLSRIGDTYLAKPSPLSETLQFFRQLSTDTMFADVAATPGDRPRDPRGGYVGGQRCADCHTDVAVEHAASAHGRPSKAIAATPFAASTGCMGCHVTAPYFEGGWKGPKDDSDMGGVSCEACHGPGEAHVRSQSKDYGHVGFERCADCHTPDRSIDFDAEAAWKRAGHKLR
jgi:Cytochrome c554 and c-prime